MGDPAKYHFTSEAYGDVAVLRLEDSHYHSDCMEPLEAALIAAADLSKAAMLVADMSKVVLLSSTALRALRARHIALEAKGGRIVSAGGGELVASVVKFAPFIRHFADLHAALAELSADAAATYSKRGS